MMQFRIYYEDTDAGGVVYHGRYLGFFERGRTEYFREKGFSVAELHDAGQIFPVVRIEIDYRYPARLDDLVQVDTAIASAGKTSFTMAQRLSRVEDGKLCAEAKVTLVCVDATMKPRRLPPLFDQVVRGA